MRFPVKEKKHSRGNSELPHSRLFMKLTQLTKMTLWSDISHCGGTLGKSRLGYWLFYKRRHLEGVKNTFCFVPLFPHSSSLFFLFCCLWKISSEANFRERRSWNRFMAGDGGSAPKCQWTRGENVKQVWENENERKCVGGRGRPRGLSRWGGVSSAASVGFFSSHDALLANWKGLLFFSLHKQAWKTSVRENSPHSPEWRPHIMYMCFLHLVSDSCYLKHYVFKLIIASQLLFVFQYWIMISPW